MSIQKMKTVDLEQVDNSAVHHSPVRRHTTAAWLLAIVACIILAWFVRTAPLGETATFVLTPSDEGFMKVPDLILPVGVTLICCVVCAIVMAILAALVGRTQGRLAHGLARVPAGVWIAVPALLFVGAFLVWAVAGQSISLIGMLQGALVGAVPILFAALSGVLCERSGVVNIAIEGMMLSAAFTSVIAASVTHSLLLGVLVGMATGVLLAMVHAYLSIGYAVDQVVSGTVVNIFSIGLTSYLSQRFLQSNFALNNSGTVTQAVIPGLAQIPIIGPLLFANNPFFYAAVVLVIVVNLLLFHTRFGLRIRAVGEHPRAADTLGINVYLTRYLSVALGGAVAGLGGAYFTIGSVGRFDEVMTAGKGFIGLAAMIFGKWTPVGSMWASLLFGFADALQTKLQILFIPIPSEFLLMIPYVVTMVVLSGLVGKAVSPAADGKPYEK